MTELLSQLMELRTWNCLRRKMPLLSIVFAFQVKEKAKRVTRFLPRVCGPLLPTRAMCFKRLQLKENLQSGNSFGII